MNKVVFNNCYGGYNLSETAIKWLMDNARDEIKQFLKEKLEKIEKEVTNDSLRMSNIELAGCRLKYDFGGKGIQRHDKDLVACVEALGDKASGFCSSLAIHTLKGNTYRIDEYDGLETIIEPDDEDYIYIE